MAASNYSVNIKLNTKPATNELKKLEARINKLRTNLNSPLKIDTRVSKINKEIAKSKDAQKASMIETRNIGNQIQKAADQGLKVDKARAAVRRAAVLDSKNQLKSAATQRKLALDELKIERKNTEQQAKQLELQGKQLETAGARNAAFRGRGTSTASTGGGGRSSVLSGALISGSFPLLFGQGPLGAAAGFGGGLIGGAIGGQMGGFAGGLVATALLQTVTNTVNGINELGAALNDPTQNLDKLVTNLSRFDRGLSTSVSILQSAGLTASAGQLAKARFGMEFGAGGANSLEEMNKAFKEFGKVTARLGTELAILASGPLTGFMKVLNFVLGGGGNTSKDKNLGQTIDDTIRQREKAIEKVLSLENSIQENIKRRNELREKFDTKEEQRDLAAKGELATVQAEFRRLGGEIQAGQTDIGILKSNIENFDATLKLTELQQKILKENERDLKAQIELEKARFEGSEEELIVLEQRAKIKKLEFGIEKQIAEVEAVKKDGSKAELERAEQTLTNLKLQLDLEEQITLNRLNAADPAISRMRDLNKEMKELNDLSRQSVELSKRMGSSFENSFKGIVKGTMTVQDAFRNMLNRIADFFLDTAAQMVANQLQQSILGMFGNMFNFNTTPLNDIQNTPVYAANGGPVGYKNPYIVGERGPELFVPNQSGNIIPSHDLAGIGGGSTNIVVNVDASGSSVEGDEQQGRELGRMISVAIQSELIKQKRPGGMLA